MTDKAFTVIFTTSPEQANLLNATGIYTLLANTVNILGHKRLVWDKPA